MAGASHSRASRRNALVAAAAVAVAVAMTALLRSGETPCPQVECTASGEPVWPGADWRPYAATSPFNEPLPADPPLDRRSDAIVQALAAGPAELRANGHDTPDDFYRPVFYAGPAAPRVRVRCTMPWGRCPLEGMRIPLPDDARPAAGDDGHLTVVDRTTGWEYDLWQAGRPRDGVLEVSFGGRVRLDGSGLGSDAVAARFGTLAGLVRPEELAAGRIDHAVLITVPCTQGEEWVAPALKGGAPCRDGRVAPLLGMRLQLDMTAAEIDALGAPRWKAALLHALRRYGAIIGDTGGPSAWNVILQSDTTYTALGEPPRMLELAERAGWRPVHDENLDRRLLLGDLASGVDWTRMRVVAPSVSRSDRP